MSGALKKSWRSWTVPLDREAQIEHRKINAEVAESRLAMSREHLERSRAMVERVRSVLPRCESEKRN